MMRIKYIKNFFWICVSCFFEFFPAIRYYYSYWFSLYFIWQKEVFFINDFILFCEQTSPGTWSSRSGKRKMSELVFLVCWAKRLHWSNRQHFRRLSKRFCVQQFSTMLIASIMLMYQVPMVPDVIWIYITCKVRNKVS